MYVPKRAVLALLIVAVFAGSAMTAASALGHKAGPAVRHHRHGARTVLDTSLAPSIRTDPLLFEVMPGMANWVLRFGRAELRSDGRLRVIIRGLVIPDPPFTGTPGPVTTVDAALYCNDRSPAVATSQDVPISRDGDATIEAKFTLPSKCLAQALLIHPNRQPGIYIAASGFGG